MVTAGDAWTGVQVVLSVLALSSRFDGQPDDTKLVYVQCSFSTRSVESF